MEAVSPGPPRRVNTLSHEGQRGFPALKPLAGVCRSFVVLLSCRLYGFAVTLTIPSQWNETMLIQKLRLKRGWSQQQLADASGLSVRTIQRIESGQPASTETLKSIAAVFEIDFSTLSMEEPQMTNPAAAAEHEEQEAFDYVRKLRGFYIHLIQYVVVVAILLAINLLVSPNRFWVHWVAGGWGLGVAMHAFRVCWPYRLFGPQWERQQVERRLGRSL